MSSSARVAFSGGKPIAYSLRTSTSLPPRPNTTTGPKVGSVIAPARSSRACGRRTIGCTENPSSRAPGASRSSRAAIPSAASTAATSLSTSRTTPPTSDLCETSGESSFTTAGKPSSRAIAPASAGVWAMRVGTVWTPYAASTAFASGSVSISRPSASTAAIMARAAPASGGSAGIEGGVSRRRSWFRWYRTSWRNAPTACEGVS